MIDINLTNMFLYTKTTFKLITKKKKNHIINISSIIKQINNPNQTNYTTTKNNILKMSISNTKKFNKHKITINYVYPKFIKSNITNKLPTKYLNKIKKNIPLEHLNKTNKITNLVKYLTTDPSYTYITNHTFNIDNKITINT